METRIYLVQFDSFKGKDTARVSDKKFIEMAEKEGTIYSLTGFEAAFNSSDVSADTQIMRIITPK